MTRRQLEFAIYEAVAADASPGQIVDIVIADAIELLESIDRTVAAEKIEKHYLHGLRVK